jgi:hypothetical protein
MSNAGLEPERRSASIRYIRQALSAAAPVHDKLVPMSATASRAAEIKVAMSYLTKALEILQDERGAHWQAASPLEEAQRTLYGVGGTELDGALHLTKQALAEVAQHRTDTSGRVPT